MTMWLQWCIIHGTSQLISSFQHYAHHTTHLPESFNADRVHVPSLSLQDFPAFESTWFFKLFSYFSCSLSHLTATPTWALEKNSFPASRLVSKLFCILQGLAQISFSTNIYFEHLGHLWSTQPHGVYRRCHTPYACMDKHTHTHTPP